MADQFYGLTDTGKQRTNNEDTFIVQLTADSKFIIACVIDGVGGYSGGEVAAALARKAILQRLSKTTGEIIPILIDCFSLANKTILDEKQTNKDHDSMACVATLALIDLEKNQFYYAHVGDTRLYLQRDGSLIKISRDQSFVGYLEDSHRISEEEAMAHPKRNEINKALGFEVNFAKDDGYIETGQSPFLPGDMLLLCSDGLTDMVGATEINAIITDASTLKNKCQQLIDAANAKGGADNITVVLAANNKQPLKFEATMPMASQKSEPTAAANTVTPSSLKEESRDVPPLKPQTNNTWLVMTLGLLTLAFLAGNVWQYIQNSKTSTVVAQAVYKTDTLSVGPLQIKLEKAIANLQGNLLLLTDTDYASPIKISRTINVMRDTLFIKTKGKIELVADSAFSGAGLTLSQQCRMVMLDSLTMKNFKTGIIAHNNVLLLKNLRFDNCAVAVQNLLMPPANKFISGTMQVLKADSIPVNSK
ncbi:PP2C family protein-serine/threonine phosphatase [Mucilaginibacter antarcticus]|uniref:PP2C family protein-serine/threonine phosphatase n=1 Tax=Mucilaginibacter antarcticus TaxID=1855725 RepID=UPI00363332BE